jgi:DNA-binding transcriptional LysR family regulator
MTQWFQHAGVEPERVSTCNSLGLMTRLVASGHGVAIMPPAMSRSEIKAGDLRVLATRPPVPARPMHLVHSKNREAFRPFVRMVSEAMQASGLLMPR